MEFPFNCARAFRLEESAKGPQVALVDTATTRGTRDLYGRTEQLRKVLETMGVLSARAQGLRAAITSLEKLTSDQRIYVLAEGSRVFGLIKVGPKKLFIEHRGMVEMTPLSVLDFYIHESVQRGGFGRALFEEMLAREKTAPALLAYDRPSQKLMGFLRKHYGLAAFTPQNNNFVVFDRYFEELREKAGRRRDSDIDPRVANQRDLIARSRAAGVVSAK
jgi:alpha-tubulin N-acetyltransferase 1